MLIPTHMKRPYLAECIQFNGINYDEIIPLFDNVEIYRDLIVIRHSLGITTLYPTDWVVIGENSIVKTYTNEIFHIKYVKHKIGLNYMLV